MIDKKINKNKILIDSFFKYFIDENMRAIDIEKLHGVDRRDLSYLKNIRSILSEDEFMFVANCLKNNEYINTESSGRTRSIDTLSRLIIRGEKIKFNCSNEMVLYVLSANNNYKIGIAKSINRRVDILQTGNPYKISIVKTYTMNSEKDARLIEKKLHKKYYKHRMVGEWFSFPCNELIEIDKIVNEEKLNNLRAITPGS